MGQVTGTGNDIDATAQIAGDVTIGSFNHIGRNVTIASFKGSRPGPIVIGDCNQIHDNTRILVGPDGLSMGDWNVLHNSMLVMGDRRLEIGHNCWFGQNTILDSTAGLYIGNGVRVGMYSQLWTHAASGELIEGCTLFASKPTHIEDDVWLVGSCIVGSGIRLGTKSICLVGSVVTKNTEARRVYSGVPAGVMERLNFWKEVTLPEKLQMVYGWAREFCKANGKFECALDEDKEMVRLSDRQRDEVLVFCVSDDVDVSDKSTSYFSLRSKTYTKRLTTLERAFYSYLYNHKARFIPRVV
jgi:acetyltransferase-like isoleucine patch superfamily enzyme